MCDIAAAEYHFGRIYRANPEIALDIYWDDMICVDSNKNYLVFFSTGELLGRVALQEINNDNPELALVLVKKYQSQGYGYLLLKQWLSWVYKETQLERIIAKIDKSNTKSIAMVSKLGAVIDNDADLICCHLDLPFESFV